LNRILLYAVADRYNSLGGLCQQGWCSRSRNAGACMYST